MTVLMLKPGDIDIDEVDKGIHRSLQNLVYIAEENFQLSYRNWESENVPEFKTEVREGAKLEVEYSTTSEPYVWVDDGTPPHEIKAVNYPTLKFRVPSYPKTQPKRLVSLAGGFGNTWVSKEKVKHPGIEPRNFSEEVVKVLDELAEPEFDGMFLSLRSL